MTVSAEGCLHSYSRLSPKVRASWNDLFWLVATETARNEFVQPPRPIFGIADFLKFTTESSGLDLKKFSVTVWPEVDFLRWLSYSSFVAVWHWIVLIESQHFFSQTVTFETWLNWLWLILRSRNLDFLTQFLDFIIFL